MNTVARADGLAPDLIVPLVGFRQWHLANGVLTSMYDRALWPPDGVTARCDRGHSSAEIPAKDCSCGVYAYYDPCPRTASAATSDLIGGAVVLWGRIEAHIYGMRGEHARIVALELPLSRGRKRRDPQAGGAAPIAEGGRSGAWSGASAGAPPKEDPHPGRQRVGQERAGLIKPSSGVAAIRGRRLSMGEPIPC